MTRITRIRKSKNTRKIRVIRGQKVPMKQVEAFQQPVTPVQFISWPPVTLKATPVM